MTGVTLNAFFTGQVFALLPLAVELSDKQIVALKILTLIAVFMLVLPTVYVIQTFRNRKKKKYLKKVIDQTMLAFSKTLDAKDPYTRGHSEAVAKYSREIARRYGVKASRLDGIYYAGLLHDIGKIGIPDSILNKPDKLTDDEYASVKLHTTVGADILSELTAVKNIAIGAREHHERYDGSGYPHGLKGGEISLEGRIIGVADAYDAMASERVYHKVFSKEEIRAEFEKGAGVQFDPKIVKILIEMIDSGYFDRQ